MKKYLSIAIAVVVCLLIFGATPVAADSGVIISSNGSVPLLVNGVQVQTLPVAVEAGSQVSVAQSTYYVSQGERYTFQQWSDGEKNTTITPEQNGTYQAIFSHEVLVIINSAVAKFQQSEWVPYGQPLEVKVDQTVSAAQNVQYVFSSWSSGQTPYQADNIVVPLGPTTLQVNWLQQSYLNVEATDGVSITGSGWYTNGTSIVLQAPTTVAGDTTGEQLAFDSWQSVGVPAIIISGNQQAAITITVNGPYTIQANYKKQYYVVADSPFGSVKRDWVDDGAEITLQVPGEQDVVANEERLVFTGWQGATGLTSPSLGVTVNQPINISAEYETQYMVTVNSPVTAAGGGWYASGSVATISAPARIFSGLISTKLLIGFSGYTGNRSTVQVTVKEPTTVTALYRTSLNVGVLLLFLLIPMVAMGLIFLYNWLKLRRR